MYQDMAQINWYTFVLTTNVVKLVRFFVYSQQAEVLGPHIMADLRVV